MNRFFVSMGGPLLTILMTAATARAEATEVDPRDGPKHRVSAGLGLTPLASFFAPENDTGSFPDDTKTGMLQTSVEATYGSRPLRHLEIGVGLGYRYLLKSGERYGHALRVPAHVGVPSVDAASTCTYYSDDTHSTIVGQYGYDCCNNKVAWGVKSKYALCGGCFVCTPPPVE